MSEKSKKIRTLIVDDEPLARRTIRDLLETDSEIEIIGECRSGAEAVQFIRRQSPDLVFLDVQMPGLNGFDVLREIGQARLPFIIFVTAFDQYALKAFDVHALDYLLKPFTDSRFWEALRQAKSHLELREINRLSQSLRALLEDRAAREEAPLKQKSFLTRFMVRTGARVHFIKASDVDWIAADDYYVKLNVAGKSHLLRASMNDLETRLDPQKFLRVHRSTIINFDRVKELHQNPNGEYVVVLKDGTELKPSRSRRDRLEELLTGGID